MLLLRAYSLAWVVSPAALFFENGKTMARRRSEKGTDKRDKRKEKTLHAERRGSCVCSQFSDPFAQAQAILNGACMPSAGVQGLCPSRTALWESKSPFFSHSTTAVVSQAAKPDAAPASGPFCVVFGGLAFRSFLPFVSFFLLSSYWSLSFAHRSESSPIDHAVHMPAGARQRCQPCSS